MKYVDLDLSFHQQLLDLEGQMYWDTAEWKKIWEKEAKMKFSDLITDYLTNFPQGCFGLTENGELVGSIFLIKLSELRPIPYVNKISDYLNKSGDTAYVSFFVVKKGNNSEEIARELYDKSEVVAHEIGCNKIAVVINNSPLEEKVLIDNDFEKSKEEYQWEIYPGMEKVPCHIYSCSLLMEESA